MNEKNQKPKMTRKSFFSVKLTDEALKYQTENYDKLPGFSSARAKASLAYAILHFIGFMTFLGNNPSESNGVAYFLFAFGIIMTIAIYKWTVIGVGAVFVVLLLNALMVIANDPTTVLFALIAFYVLLYFLYPAYQVEKNRRSKKTATISEDRMIN